MPIDPCKSHTCCLEIPASLIPDHYEAMPAASCHSHTQQSNGIMIKETFELIYTESPVFKWMLLTWDEYYWGDPWSYIFFDLHHQR